MSRFVRQQDGRAPVHVQFIVTSDSLAWVKRSVNFTSIVERLNQTSAKVDLDLAHSEGHDDGFDLALLSLCDWLRFGRWKVPGPARHRKGHFKDIPPSQSLVASTEDD